jgi:hypothetical protein
MAARAGMDLKMVMVSTPSRTLVRISSVMGLVLSTA